MLKSFPPWVLCELLGEDDRSDSDADFTLVVSFEDDCFEWEIFEVDLDGRFPTI